MRRFSIFLPVLALAIAACNGGTGDTTTTAGETPSTTAPVETTTSTAAATTTTAPNTTTSVSASGGSDCLVGTWVLDNESFVDAIRSAFEQPGVDMESIEPAGGTYTIELDADGSFTGTRDEWGFVITMSEGSIDIIIDGTESGTWSAEDSTLTVNSSGADVDVTMTMETDGVTTELPSSSVDLPEAMQTASTYECEGDTLSVTSEGVTTVMTRA